MADERTIDECLSARNGRLYVEDCDATALVERFGSPLFVVSETQLRRNLHHYRATFAAYWPGGRVEILPAIKANWSLAVRRILTEEGAGCDVYSPGELWAALSSGVDPAKVSANGGGKSDDHIAKCISAGVRITVDAAEEFDRIEAAAATLGKTASIRFRLKPALPDQWRPTDFALELVPIDLGVELYKNGIPTEQLVELGRRALRTKHVEVSGFHVHLGRHHAGPSFWRASMKRYAALIADLGRAWGGYRPKEIDVGGGIPTPRDPFAKAVDRSDVPAFAAFWVLAAALRVLGRRTRYRVISKLFDAVLHKQPAAGRVPALRCYAEAVAATLRDELARLGVPPEGVTLQIEPGRSLYGDTGVHLARVLAVKRQKTPVRWTWVLLDTTCFFLAGGVLEQNLHDFVIANRTDAPPVETGDIVGRSCFADRILPEVRMPLVEEGDVVALLDTGAYQEVSASNFNALPRPATALVRGSEAEIIRRAETIEDVFRRDVVPERLAARLSPTGDDAWSASGSAGQ